MNILLNCYVPCSPRLSLGQEKHMMRESVPIAIEYGQSGGFCARKEIPRLCSRRVVLWMLINGSNFLGDGFCSAPRSYLSIRNRLARSTRYRVMASPHANH